MTDTAPQIHEMSTSETRAVAVSMVGKLDGGETLTGTPTVTEVSTTEMTLASKAVNTAALSINGATVAIGNAIQFTVVCPTPGHYSVRVECGTSESQTIDGLVRVIVCD